MIADALVLRAVARRPLRSLVTLASIAATVAVVVAVRMTATGALGAFANDVDIVAGTVTFSVAGIAQPLDKRTLFALRRIPAIADAQPVVEETIVLSAPAERVRAVGRDLLRPLPGDTDARDRFPGPYASAAAEPTRTLLAEPSLLVSRRTAAAHHVRAGGMLGALVRGRPMRLRVAAVLPESAVSADAGVVFLDVAFAQRMFAKTGLVDRIECTAAGGDAGAARAAAARVLPAGAHIIDPGAGARAVRAVLQRAHNDVRALTAFVAVLAACLVYGAAATAVAQRRRDVGALRALGASSAQILAAFLLEGAAFGVLGSLAGLQIGAALVLPLAGGTVVYDAGAMLSAAALGTVLSVVAAVLPAAGAAAVAPAAATRDRGTALRAPAHAAVAGCAAAVLLAAVFVASGHTAAAGAAIAVLAAGAAAAPFALRGATALARRSKSLGAAAPRLAARGIDAFCARNAVALCAGALAVAFAVGVGIVLATFESDAADALARAFPADIAVRAQAPGIAATLAARVRRVAGVRAASITAEGDVAVAAAPGAELAPLRERIAAAAAPLDVTIESTRDVRRAAEVLLRTPLRLGYAVSALALGCAILGVSGALAGLVLERRDEIRILRYVGMSAASVRAMVGWHAATLGVLSALLGMPVGVLAAALVLALDGGGSTFIAMPYGVLAVLPFAVVAAALLAAVPAGRAAGRIGPDFGPAGA